MNSPWSITMRLCSMASHISKTVKRNAETEGDISWRLASSLLSPTSSSSLYILKLYNVEVGINPSDYSFQWEGKGSWKFEEALHGGCQVWGCWASSSLLDGIPESGLSQAWLVMEAAAKGRGLQCLDGDLRFQSSLPWVPEGDCCVLRRLIFQRFLF